MQLGSTWNIFGDPDTTDKLSINRVPEIFRKQESWNEDDNSSDNIS